MRVSVAICFTWLFKRCPLGLDLGGWQYKVNKRLSNLMKNSNILQCFMICRQKHKGCTYLASCPILNGPWCKCKPRQHWFTVPLTARREFCATIFQNISIKRHLCHLMEIIKDLNFILVCLVHSDNSVATTFVSVFKNAFLILCTVLKKSLSIFFVLSIIPFIMSKQTMKKSFERHKSLCLLERFWYSTYMYAIEIHSTVGYVFFF